MKGLYYILILGFALTLVQCKSDKEQVSVDFASTSMKDEIKVYKVAPVPYEENKGYVLKKQISKAGVRHVKITNQAQFTNLFDLNPAMKDEGEIDFSKSFVLALVGIPSKLETKFSILSLKEKEDFIELKYCLDEVEEELLQEIRPFSILIIDKAFDKDVRFLME